MQEKWQGTREVKMQVSSKEVGKEVCKKSSQELGQNLCKKNSNELGKKYRRKEARY